MDLFKLQASLGLSRPVLLLVLLAALVPNHGCHLVHATESKGDIRAQAHDELKQSIERLIEKSYSESRFFYCCDLIRVYVELFPSSEKNNLYLSDPAKAMEQAGDGEVITLRGIKGSLLARGRESLAKAKSAEQRLMAFYLKQRARSQAGGALGQAMESEAKRLAVGDEVSAKGLLKNHEATLALYLDAALFLSSHCLIFPNSPDTRRQLGDAAKCAEIADLPLLEVELRSRLMGQRQGNPAFTVASELSGKAARQNRFFIAISAIDRFLSGNYSHANAGHGYLASGDLHKLAGCYNVALSKYNQALLWAGDMEKANRSRGDKTDLIREDIAAIKKRAALSIGYALLAEAKGKHLRESTAVFAGKLHEEAVTHFDRLVEGVESGSLFSLDYLLGQIRARTEVARYKRAHSSVLGLDEIQDAYARCLSPCEIYLRVISQSNPGDYNTPEVNIETRDEVAYVLLESLLSMGKGDEVEELFFHYFINPKGVDSSKWAILAKTKFAKRLVDVGDYLTAYPLLAEVAHEAQQSGLRDVGFTAALMMGVCISKLSPVARNTVTEGQLSAGGAGQLSGVRMARNAYSSALSMLNESAIPAPAQYPDEFRGLFLGDIREALTDEYRGEMNALRQNWNPLGSLEQETPLVDALSALDPARYPFNPNNLLVAAYLDAHRERDRSIGLVSKESTQHGAVSHK